MIVILTKYRLHQKRIAGEISKHGACELQKIEKPFIMLSTCDSS